MAAPPIQQVPLGVAVAEERVASSSSLEEENDKFQFEEEETQGTKAIFISEAKEETDKYSCVQAPAPVINYMKGRNKVSTPQEANKSKPLVNPPPPPFQLPADLGLKLVPELRRKRQHEIPDEGEIGPSKRHKQQKVTQDQRGKSLLLLRTEKSLSQLICAEHPAYGPLSWS